MTALAFCKKLPVEVITGREDACLNGASPLCVQLKVKLDLPRRTICHEHRLPLGDGFGRVVAIIPDSAVDKRQRQPKPALRPHGVNLAEAAATVRENCAAKIVSFPSPTNATGTEVARTQTANIALRFLFSFRSRPPRTVSAGPITELRSRIIAACGCASP